MQFYDRALQAFAGIQSRWRKTQPRVVMTLLCWNESDIIAEHVTFHLSMGVDFILATDNVSSDRTVEAPLSTFRVVDYASCGRRGISNS